MKNWGKTPEEELIQKIKEANYLNYWLLDVLQEDHLEIIKEETT